MYALAGKCQSIEDLSLWGEMAVHVQEESRGAEHLVNTPV